MLVSSALYVCRNHKVEFFITVSLVKFHSKNRVLPRVAFSSAKSSCVMRQALFCIFNLINLSQSLMSVVKLYTDMFHGK